MTKIDIVADKKKEDIEGLALGFKYCQQQQIHNNFPQDETAILKKFIELLIIVELLRSRRCTLTNSL